MRGCSPPNPETITNPDNSTFFRDGHRKIDFVLVYEETPRRCASVGPSVLDTSGDRRAKLETWRQRFMTNLRRAGLDMEEEVIETNNKKMICFIKLHATWPILCHHAEELNMRAPLQAHTNPSANWSHMVLKALRLPNIMYEEVPNKPLDYYTCPFRKSKLDRFLGSDDRENYFTSVQRGRILYEILSTAVFGKKKKGEVGIDRLVEEGVFSSAFPLHDGPYEVKKDGVPDSPLNARQVLYEYWARWGKWYKYQPLDHIREYFGEKIAIYFAWLGFYTGWLLPAALVGLLVFLYGLFTMHSNQLATEVCSSGKDFNMCPLCDIVVGCTFWNLSDVCSYAQLAYLFDHPGTVFYAVFMSFWAVTFLEYWKRKSVSLAHHWDCMGFQEEEERPRPEFAARAPFLERNPVTGVREPSFPSSLRNKRVAAGIGIIFLMISLVIIFIVAIIIYRVLVSIPLFQNSTFRSQAQAIANVTGAIVNLIIIMAMSRVYEKLAYRLTTWEMHRTQTEFDDNLTFKVFIFQFVNFYSSIFYIAFFKGRFVGYPGNYTRILRLRNEDCSAGGCLIELAQQLAVIMIGKQIINNAQEIFVPKMKGWWQKKQLKLSKKHKTRWEEDYQLINSEGLFQEYLEMVLQFGFITIFVAAFPLAPLFALLNNWVEIRLDAQKFVCETRRIVAERAENIGIWFKILDMLAHLAVISNAFLIAFTSEFLPKLLYQYEYDWNLMGYVNFTLAYAPPGTMPQQCRYRGLRDDKGNQTPFFWRLLAVRLAFVIVFEHVVFGICRLIDVLVPDVPESLELKIKRERYLAKQALQDSDTIMKVAARMEDDDSVLSGGMVLDLTSELGGLVQETPPLAETNNTSTESQTTNQTTSVVSQQCTDPNVSRRKLKT
jgi:anoctamin-7